MATNLNPSRKQTPAVQSMIDAAASADDRNFAHCKRMKRFADSHDIAHSAITLQNGKHVLRVGSHANYGPDRKPVTQIDYVNSMAGLKRLLGY